MSIAISRTKIIVGDADAAERFYTGIGLKLVRRFAKTGSADGHTNAGRNMTRQKQCWVSETGDETSHVIIFSQFLEFPAPTKGEFPGGAWLWFRVSDVDETIRRVASLGGSVAVPAHDSPTFPVRAACVRDPEGQHIEIVGPRVGS